jgi:hypothetical protein
MRKLIAVAVVSALSGAGLTLWAKSTVLATGIPAAPAVDVAGISAEAITRAAGTLPVRTLEDVGCPAADYGCPGVP